MLVQALLTLHVNRRNVSMRGNRMKSKILILSLLTLSVPALAVDDFHLPVSTQFAFTLGSKIVEVGNCQPGKMGEAIGLELGYPVARLSVIRQYSVLQSRAHELTHPLSDMYDRNTSKVTEEIKQSSLTIEGPEDKSKTAMQACEDLAKDLRKAAGL